MARIKTTEGQGLQAPAVSVASINVRPSPVGTFLEAVQPTIQAVAKAKAKEQVEADKLARNQSLLNLVNQTAERFQTILREGGENGLTKQERTQAFVDARTTLNAGAAQLGATGAEVNALQTNLGQIINAFEETKKEDVGLFWRQEDALGNTWFEPKEGLDLGLELIEIYQTASPNVANQLAIAFQTGDPTTIDRITKIGQEIINNNAAVELGLSRQKRDEIAVKDMKVLINRSYQGHAQLFVESKFEQLLDRTISPDQLGTLLNKHLNNIRGTDARLTEFDLLSRDQAASNQMIKDITNNYTALFKANDPLEILKRDKEHAETIRNMNKAMLGYTTDQAQTVLALEASLANRALQQGNVYNASDTDRIVSGEVRDSAEHALFVVSNGLKDTDFQAMQVELGFVRTQNQKLDILRRFNKKYTEVSKAIIAKKPIMTIQDQYAHIFQFLNHPKIQDLFRDPATLDDIKPLQRKLMEDLNTLGSKLSKPERDKIQGFITEEQQREQELRVEELRREEVELVPEPGAIIGEEPAFTLEEQRRLEAQLKER